MISNASPSVISNGNTLGTDGNGIGGHGEGAADAALGLLMQVPSEFTDDFVNPVGEGQNSPTSPTLGQTNVAFDNDDV